MWILLYEFFFKPINIFKVNKNINLLRGCNENYSHLEYIEMLINFTCENITQI